MKTATVGIREAKTHLSRYLKIVGQGTEIILTDRGVPVGKIVPIQAEQCSLEQRLKKLETAGILCPQPERNIRTPSRPTLAVQGDTAQRFLQEDRGHD